MKQIKQNKMPLIFVLFAVITFVTYCVCCNNVEAKKQIPSKQATAFKTNSLPKIVTKKRPIDLPDIGIWPNLNKKIHLNFPSKIESSTILIVVDKAKRVLNLLSDNVPLISYPIALGFAPVGHKKKQGDGKTPEGEYYICEMLHKNLKEKYGARSLRISYPNIRDAAFGKKKGLITKHQQLKIETAIKNGDMPSQKTALGSSIRIHGGGVGGDWTHGCVALRDDDIIDMYSVLKNKDKVLILGKKDSKPYGDLDGDGIPNQVDGLLGAKKTVVNGAKYDGKYVQIPSKNGDVPKEIGVCTDVIVRAFRNAGLDLQAEIQRDYKKRKGAYPRISSPNSSIDHRRVKNLVPWFKRYWLSLPIDEPETYLPGDILFFDTLPAKGADHVGIVSDKIGKSGLPLIINNWTHGSVTAELDLLDFVPVLGHYRWKK